MSDARTAETSVPEVETDHPLIIAYRPLMELKPYARNARRHTATQLGKIKASLQRFGWTTAMAIADGVMVAEHGRLAAAIDLAKADLPIRGNPDRWRGPVIDLSHLSADERAAYRIADNRIAQDAGWDHDLLQVEMADLSARGIDLSLTGFAKVEIETLLGAATSAGNRLASAALQYQVIVECSGETHQAEMIAEFKAKGLKCRPLIL